MRVTECDCVARRCQNESSISWQQQWPCPLSSSSWRSSPSPCFIEPYNATLSVHQVVEIADECMYMIGNEALPTSAFIPCSSPSQPMVTSTMYRCSACIYVCLPCIRSAGQQNSDLRIKLGANLVPFSRLHLSFIGFEHPHHSMLTPVLNIPAIT